MTTLFLKDLFILLKIRGNNLNSNFIKDFKIDININRNIKTNSDLFRDRYIILDYKIDNESIYHYGASSKDARKRITTMTKIDEKEVYEKLIDKVLNNKNLNI